MTELHGAIKKTMFTCTEKTLNQTSELIDKVRKETGYKVSRATLIQVLLEIAIESNQFIELDNVADRQSLKIALVEAFKNNKV